MRAPRTFPRGGVRPPDHKSSTSAIPIRKACVPAEAFIALQQHQGSPAECVVAPGDRVTEGMLIGRSSGSLSANIHASIPGVVREIGELELPNGARSRCVTILLEGEFRRSGRAYEPVGWRELSAGELLEKIGAQGVVGLGGACFPTAEKYRRVKAPADLFILNGMECEPFLNADRRLMLEKPQEIITGAQIAARILEPRRIMIAFAADCPDVREAMERAAAAAGLDCELAELEPRFPQGDELQLLLALLGRKALPRGSATGTGAVVSNVSTLQAVYQAVVMDMPLIERIVTVAGSAVRTPANLKARLGTRIGELIEECGGLREPRARVIAGGPMTGFALSDLNTPVTKAIAGVIVLSGKEARPPSETSCIGCGRCLTACPWGLNPTELYKRIEHGELGQEETEELMECTECGCCAYVCPARIPLVRFFRKGKALPAKV